MTQLRTGRFNDRKAKSSSNNTSQGIENASLEAHRALCCARRFLTAAEE
jgi:hypothetical protein